MAGTEIPPSTTRPVNDVSRVPQDAPDANREAYRDVSPGRDENGLVMYNLDADTLRAGTERILDVLLADPDVVEIHNNGGHLPAFIVHRKLGTCVTNARFDDQRVAEFVGRVAAANGVDLVDRPMVDLRLYGLYRMHVVMPPVSDNRPTFLIRQSMPELLSMPSLIANGTITADAAAYLWCCVDGLGANPANVMVCGRPSSGRTTMLNALLRLVPLSQRIATIEHHSELRLVHPNHIQLRADRGVEMVNLVTNALRQRPDRIVIGDVMGPEAAALLNAMGTGHWGSMGAFCARDAQAMVDELGLPPSSCPPHRVKVVDLVVVTDRIGVTREGRRIVSAILEVSDADDEGVKFHPVYLYNPVEAQLQSTNMGSELMKRFAIDRGMKKDELQAIRDRRASILGELAEKRAGLGAVLQAVVTEHKRVNAES